jgi:branched-chain amino acid transport system ATP-binding protein
MPEIILEVKNLSRQFGGVKAVDAVSFSLAQRQIASVIGPNGAGKTTLFNLITGFVSPDAGSILLHGRDITGTKPHKLAAHGLIRTFQLVRLFKRMTVLENLLVGFHLCTHGGIGAAILRAPTIRTQEQRVTSAARELLALVGLAEQADMLAGQLTYGQQRLLEVARGFAAGPKVLLLDEPAAGLNPAETQQLATVIRWIRDQDVSVLFIEHDMNMVMTTAEKVIVLDFGRKIAEGDPDSMQSNPAVVEAYLGGS